MTMTIEEKIRHLDEDVFTGKISPEEAEAELGAILDNETANDMRSAGISW